MASLTWPWPIGARITVSVSLALPDGSFVPKVDYATASGPVCRFLTVCEPTREVAGEFTADGKLDLIVSNPGDNTLSFLRGNGDGTFQRQVSSPGGAKSTGLTALDLNIDGHLDVAVGRRTARQTGQ